MLPLSARFVPVMLLCCLVGACTGRQDSPGPTVTDQETGSTLQEAPDFTLTTLDGTPMRLKDLRGKVVFLNLWATWCPPCREELPTMVRFYQEYRDRGVEILAVSEDTDPRAVRKMVARQGLTFPVLMDENKRVYGLYRATGVPETHLIDKAGKVRASQLGPFDWTDPGVLRTIDKLLAE